MGIRLNRNAHLSRNRARLAHFFRQEEFEESTDSDLLRNDAASVFAIALFIAILVYLIWRA